MSRIKRITSIVLVFTLCLIIAPKSNAVTTDRCENHICEKELLRIPHMSSKCPICHTWNNNYGYDKWFRSGTTSYRAGDYCEYCNSSVPSGELHTVTYWEDKYFYVCSSCGYFYEDFGPKQITDHYVFPVV